MRQLQRYSRPMRVCLGVTTVLAVACFGGHDADVLQITRPDSTVNIPRLTGAPTAPGTVVTVTVMLDSTSLSVGHVTPAHAIAQDATGTLITGHTVTWSSSNPSIASVAAGIVTAKKAGTASISAKIDDITGTATITVPVSPKN